VLVLATSIAMSMFGQGVKPDHVVIILLAVMLLSVAGAAWHCFKVGRRM
jgi:hypothetical protein